MVLLNNNITKHAKREFISIIFGKYVVVGVTGFIVDSIVLNLLQHFVFKGEGDIIFNIITTSKLISGTVGISVSFYLNRNWTFESYENSVAKESSKMALSFLFSILIGAILYTVYEDILELQEIINFGSLLETFANAMVSGTLLILNFFIYKFFVFKK